VVIDVATATTIQIFQANVTVQSITTNAQIECITQTLTASTINASANILLDDGTIANSTINMAPGVSLVGESAYSGALIGDTVSGLIEMSQYCQILNGLTLNNATMMMLSGGGTGAIDFTTSGGGLNVFAGSATLTIGAGITFEGNSYEIGTNFGADTIINQSTIVAAGGGTITMNFQVNQADPSSFINEGALEVSDGETLSIQGPWTNASGATISATGATLDLDDQLNGSTNAWSNAGTINVNNCTLNLGGLFTLPGMGNFNQSANTVNLIGTLDNTGTTLALSPATGSWILDGGTLENGTLTETDGAELVFTTSGTLDGVTVDGNLDLAASSGGQAGQAAAADVVNGLVLNGTAYIGNAAGTAVAALYFANTETLSGTGTVVFGASNSDEMGGSGIWFAPTTLTIGAGITIYASVGSIETNATINQGAIIASPSGTACTFYVNGDVTNEGTIQAETGETLYVYNCTNTAGATINASGATLGLSGALTNELGGSVEATNSTVTLGDPNFNSTTNWSNTGSIDVRNSNLDLGGLFTIAAMGTITHTGDSINLVGTLNNTGTTLALNATTGSWYMDGGEIENGTVAESDGAELIFTGDNSTLNAVTVDGDLDLTGNLVAPTPFPFNEVDAFVINGLMLNGTAYLGNASGTMYGVLYFNNTETLSGTGTVDFGENGSNAISNYWDFATGLTIGPGITIRGTSGAIENFDQSINVVDEGAIVVDSNGGIGSLLNDTDFSGGTAGGVSVPIDTSAVTNPAPQAVYQTERYGTFSYTLPNLTPNGSYSVTLGFAELDAGWPGEKLMNVSINGTQVLTSFDVFATTGARYKAVDETFPATANNLGQVVINFSPAAGSLLQASVNEIELDSGNKQVLAINAGGFPGSTGIGFDTSAPLYIDDPGYLSTPNNGYIDIDNSVLGNTHNALQYQVSGTLAFVGWASASSPQLFEAMSDDMGATPAGFINNFAYGTLSLPNATYVELVDQSQNSGSSQPEAVYADKLVVAAGATLNLNGLHLYVGSEQVAGTIVGGTVTVVNLPPPAITSPGMAAVDENSTLAFTGGNALNVSDPGGTAEQLTLSVSNGTLAVNPAANVTVTGNGTGSVVISGQIAGVDSVVASLVYSPAPGYSGSDLLSISDEDMANGLLGSTSTALIINGYPAFQSPGSINVNENEHFTFAGSIAVWDTAASGTSDSLTLLVNDGTLALGSTSGLNFVSGANNSSSMTIAGTLTNLNAAVDGLVYAPTCLYTGPDSLQLSVADAADNLSSSASVAILVNALAPPAVAAPVSASLNENGSFTFAGTISAVDATAAGSSDSVSLAVSHGTLTLGSMAGISFSSGSNDSSSMTIDGTLANLNAALSGLVYAPNLYYVGFDSLQISMNDSIDGLAGSGSVALTVNSVPPPAVTAPATASLNENSSYTFSSSTISLTDTTASGASDSVSLSVANGTLTLGSTAGITFSSGSNGSSSMTINGTLANLNTALAGLTYGPNLDYVGSDTLRIAVIDSVDRLSGSGSVALTINAVAPPAVTAMTTASLKENSSYTFSSSAFRLADATASGASDSLTLSVAFGKLALGSTSGLTFSSGANNSSSMTVTGTLANLNAALSGLVYTPTSGFSGHDSLALSLADSIDKLTGSASVAIAVNPYVTAPATANVLENASYTFSSSGGDPISATDGGAVGSSDSLTLTVLHGKLTLSSLTGLTIKSGANGSSSITVQGTLANLNAALNGLVYTPALGYTGLDTLTVTIADSGDGLSGSASVALTVAMKKISPAITMAAPVAVSSNSIVDDPSDQWAGVSAAVDLLNS
jgi:Malectin domain